MVYGPASTAAALALSAALTLAAVCAHAASVGELTAELDRAQEQAEYARLAARFELLTSSDADGAAAAFIQLSRAYYLLGEAEKDKKKRAGFLDRAIGASERALALSPEDPVALYWRSMAYLQKADIEGGLSALRMVKRALSDFEKVEAAEPAYDGAGAYRSHGRVLMEAPAWAFIGDKKRGVALLEKAGSIAPRTLINRLYLAEAYSAAGRRDDARRELMFILDAPVGELKPKDDMATKRDAAKLLDGLGR